MNRSVPRFAAFILAGAAAIAAATAVQAQRRQAAPAPQPQPQGRELNITRDERSALTALAAAAAGSDRAAQDAALARARSVARAADARYALGQYQYQIALQRQDGQLLGQAVDMIVESGVAQPAQLVPLLANQAARAVNNNDFRIADRALLRLVEAQPNNPDYVADLAQVKSRLGNRPEAVTLFQRAIGLAGTGGRPAPEAWYRRGLALAVEARLAPQATALALGLAEAYPTPINWRDSVMAWRDLSAADGSADLDVNRLLRANQALAGERDYLEFATALNQAGLAGEAKAVLDEGVSRNMLETSKAAVSTLLTAVNRRVTQERPTLARLRTQAGSAATGAPARTAADTHFGYGQYAEAAELYRSALTKGGEDANLVNLRLGAALALAGNRAEAEAAFRAVTGPRADLARFWLAWLARR